MLSCDMCSCKQSVAREVRTYRVYWAVGDDKSLHDKHPIDLCAVCKVGLMRMLCHLNEHVKQELSVELAAEASAPSQRT